MGPEAQGSPSLAPHDRRPGPRSPDSSGTAGAYLPRLDLAQSCFPKPSPAPPEARPGVLSPPRSQALEPVGRWSLLSLEAE